MRSYDFLVIGGGSAGYAAARVAADLGKRVAIVDGAKELGGLCILRGCMPSKAILHATDVLYQAQHAKSIGVRIPEASMDMKALHRWKKKVIREFADYRVGQLESSRYDLYRSFARFIGAHEVVLTDGTVLQGERIFIATGSKVSVPDVPGLKEIPFWTSDDVLDLDFIPESVIVLGGGVVACELAQFLNRIGSRVTLIQRGPNLLKGAPAEASEVIRASFLDEGINVLTETKIEAIAVTSAGVSVKFRHQGKSRRKRAAHLFNALGREPNTSALDLAVAGVEVSEGGKVSVNRWQQTSAPHIYAGGDVCCPEEIVHIAVAHGELAARHAFGQKEINPIDSDLGLFVIFTDPPLATVGLQERQLQERGIEFLAASYPFDDHGKSILMTATRGYVKIYAEPKKGRLLGAEIVGIQADSLIHCLSVPLAMNATVHDLLKAPWYHPTLAEILTYPLEELAEQIAK